MASGKRWTHRSIPDQRFQQLSRAGFNCTNIAEILGISRESARRRLMKLGLHKVTKSLCHLPPQEVVRLVNAGHTMRDVGEIFGCSHAAVRRCYRRALGIPDSTPMPTRECIAERNAKILEMFKAGTSIDEIRTVMGCGSALVEELRIAAGLRPRPRGRTPRKLPQDVAERLDAFVRRGLQAFAIARELRVSEATVRRWIAKARKDHGLCHGVPRTSQTGDGTSRHDGAEAAAR